MPRRHHLRPLRVPWCRHAPVLYCTSTGGRATHGSEGGGSTVYSTSYILVLLYEYSTYSRHTPSRLQPHRPASSRLHGTTSSHHPTPSNLLRTAPPTTPPHTPPPTVPSLLQHPRRRASPPWIVDGAARRGQSAQVDIDQRLGQAAGTRQGSIQPKISIPPSLPSSTPAVISQ